MARISLSIPAMTKLPGEKIVAAISLFCHRRSKRKCRCRPKSNRTAEASGACVKAKIIITPKKVVVDPQGKTVQRALAHMGYSGIGAVHVGKYLEIELDGQDKESARKQIDDACHKFLSNPVIEDYRFELE